MADVTDRLRELTRITVHAKPNAKRTAVMAYDEETGILKMDIAAPPEKGKANKELCSFLKKKLGKDVTLVSGATSKRKHLRIGD